MDAPIKIVLADDHEIFRDGFKVMIRKYPSVVLVGEASDGRELVDITLKLKPDIVITDIKMPGMDGIQATKILKEKLPDIGIIALSMFDEQNLIIDMLEAGALGYLLKNAHKSEIIEAINTVHNNLPYYCALTSTRLAHIIAKSHFNTGFKSSKVDFTEREREVIRLICREMSNKEIGSYLRFSTRTIEGYRDRILEKTGAKNTAGIVIYAIKNNIYIV